MESKVSIRSYCKLSSFGNEVLDNCVSFRNKRSHCSCVPTGLSNLAWFLILNFLHRRTNVHGAARLGLSFTAMHRKQEFMETTSPRDLMSGPHSQFIFREGGWRPNNQQS